MCVFICCVGPNQSARSIQCIYCQCHSKVDHLSADFGNLLWHNWIKIGIPRLLYLIIINCEIISISISISILRLAPAAAPPLCTVNKQRCWTTSVVLEKKSNRCLAVSFAVSLQWNKVQIKYKVHSGWRGIAWIGTHSHTHETKTTKMKLNSVLQVDSAPLGPIARQRTELAVGFFLSLPSL